MIDLPPPERRASVWNGRWSKHPGDPKYCRASVADGGRSPTFHQCTRRPVVERELDEPKGTYGFCRLHDPVAQAAKRRAENEKRRKEWDEREARDKARRDRITATEACIAALRRIEAGDNDPRATAREALAQLDAISQ